MDPKGDITDQFDDDSLRESIEKADKAGMWRDATGTFVDPKLEQIRKQLAEPERVDYAERRRRDLQKQALAGAAATVAPPPPEPEFKDLPKPPVDWRDTVVRVSPPPVEPTPTPRDDSDVLGQLQERIGDDPATSLPPEIQHPVLGYVRPVLTGFSVFLPITVVMMVVGGARFDLLVRGLLASIAAGVGWSEFQAGRFRAPMIGVIVYLLTFFTTPGAWGSREIVGSMVGFLMTLLGSGLVGFLREQNVGRGDGKR